VTPDQKQPSSLRSGVFWSLLSFAGTKALTFIATLILARLVAPSDFGVLAAVMAFITVLEVISIIGTKATVIYESERGITSRVQTAFTLNLIITVALTGIAIALAPLIADYFGAGSETVLFRVAALHLLLTGLGNIHDALLLRDMEFRRRIIPQLAGNIARGAVTIALAIAGLGASALVIGFVFGTSVLTTTLWLVKPFRPTLKIERAAARGIATYGGWASVLSLLAALTTRVDVAVVGGVLGATTLGLYTIAQRLPELVIGQVTLNLSIVAFPALSQRRDLGDRELTDTTLNLIRYSALFGLPVGAALAVLAEPLVVVLFSETWIDAAAIMAPFAILYGITCVVYPLGDTFKALGRQPIMVAVNAVALPLTVGVMVLTADAGGVAVAWARLGVAIALGAVWFVLISRAIGLRLPRVTSMLGPGLGVAAGAALAGFAVRAVLPEPSIGPLIVGSLACAAGAIVSLRLFAAREYADIGDVLKRRLLSTSLVPARWRTAPPVGPVEVEQAVEIPKRGV
jgi:lipopolysaccharide exporter